jgi:DNA-3-methyladenine glycosylase II
VARPARRTIAGGVIQQTAKGDIMRVQAFLPAVAPFDFSATLAFMRGFPALTGEQRTADESLVRAIREAGVVAVTRLSAAAGRSGLDCEIEAATPVPEQAAVAIQRRLSFQFGLADELGEFYRLAAEDPAFAPVVRRLYGYHQVKFPSPLELLCWAILSQRVPMAVARQAKRALVEAAGNQVPWGPETLWAFPDEQQLQDFSEERLREITSNSRKASYLYRAVRQWSDTDEEFLRTGDFDAVRECLLSFPGIGPWSASFVLIRGLGRTEHMAPDKEGLRAASRVYGHPVDEAEFTTLASRYGRWQGYWGHYLRVFG